MDATEFRNAFGRLAQQNGFLSRHGAWWQQTPESILALELQRSSYGRQYLLNVKVWLQGLGSQVYTPSRNTLREVGHIFRREPTKFSTSLDLDNEFEASARLAQLDEMFVPFCALSPRRSPVRTASGASLSISPRRYFCFRSFAGTSVCRDVIDAPSNKCCTRRRASVVS